MTPASFRGTPRTRIQVPDLAVGTIERGSLLERLAGTHLHHEVLLVCAPAGYGKTTLLTQWAHRVRAEGRPVAWVTCRTTDGDPTALLVDIRDAAVLAVDATAPQVGDQLRDLAEPSAATLESVLDTFIVILDELSTPLALVIDDVHVAQEPSAMALLEELAVRLPDRVQLALGSRAEPQPLLTTLRLTGSVVEVGVEDLALTAVEVAELIGGGSPDPVALAAELLAQTEGWPAAVRLGVLAARGGHPGGRLALPLSYDPSVSDFLSREILAGLPDEALALLRATAVISELSPRMAADLSGRPDAGAILADLFRTQALVRRVGEFEPSYVVHALLRAHLLVGLAAEDVGAPARQHAAAARWLAAHGMAERGLEHAVAAEDPSLIGALLLEVGVGLVVRGRAATVLDALAALPGHDWDPEIVGLAALARADVGDVAGARQLLEGTDDPPGPSAVGQPAQPASAAPGLLRLARFHVRRLDGHSDDPDLPRAFSDVLEWHASPDPAPADLDRQLLLLINRGQWETAAGRYDQSWRDLRLALDLATRHRRDRALLQSMSTLTAVPTLVGDAAAADRYVEEVLALVEIRGWSTHPAMASIYAAGAWAAWLMLLPSRADRMIGRAHAALVGNVDPEYAAYAALSTAVLQGDRPGDPTSPMRTLARFAQGGQSTEITPGLRAFAGMQRVRIMIRRGDLAGADDAVKDLARWVPGTADAQIGRAQMLAARGRWEQCLTVLRGIQQASPVLAVPVNQIALPLLTAVACQKLGRRAEARAQLGYALDLAAPRGAVRPFADAGPTARTLLGAERDLHGQHRNFVTTILERWERVERLADGTATPVAEGITLTRRELEVLRELPSLMTAEELAAAQLVSVNTVRTHMRALYQKLGVRTRRDAVRRGRELGLL